jgi:hypothetical protein
MWSDMLVKPYPSIKIYPNIKFHKIHPVGAKLFHADEWMYRQTGKHIEPNACFLQLFGKFAKGGIFQQKCIT